MAPHIRKSPNIPINQTKVEHIKSTYISSFLNEILTNMAAFDHGDDYLSSSDEEYIKQRLRRVTIDELVDFLAEVPKSWWYTPVMKSCLRKLCQVNIEGGRGAYNIVAKVELCKHGCFDSTKPKGKGRKLPWWLLAPPYDPTLDWTCGIKPEAQQKVVDVIKLFLDLGLLIVDLTTLLQAFDLLSYCKGNVYLTCYRIVMRLLDHPKIKQLLAESELKFQKRCHFSGKYNKKPGFVYRALSTIFPSWSYEPHPCLKDENGIYLSLTVAFTFLDRIAWPVAIRWRDLDNQKAKEMINGLISFSMCFD